MITARGALQPLLVFVLVTLICIAIVLLVGIGNEPCMEFDGWRWERIWPKPPHCQSSAE